MSDLTLHRRFTPTTGQQATLAALHDGLGDPAAVPALLLVTGEPGSGKSTMIAELMPRIGDDPGLAAGAVIDAGTEHSDARLLRAMIAAFDEEPAGRSGIELLTTLRAVFAARATAGQRPVLLIDGGEALTGSQLEVIRSLLTPATDAPDGVHPAIVLAGRPEIRERIRRRRPLAQRRTHDLQLASPGQDDLARIIGGTAEQASLIFATATQRGIAPLALTAFVTARTGDGPLGDARLRAILRDVPPGGTAPRPADEIVQTAMPFGPANERTSSGIVQLSLLQQAGDHAGAIAGGGDR